MKKALSLVLVMIIALSSFAFIGAIPAGADDTPTGTAITKAADFMRIKNDLAGNYYLANDIDFEGLEYDTYAISGSFTGTLDGRGYTVKNIKFAGNGVMGFFQNLEGATIKNIKFGASDNLIPVNVTSFKQWAYFGLVASTAKSADVTTFENVHVYADINITSTKTVGGAGGFLSRVGNDNSPTASVIMTNCSMNGSLDFNLDGTAAAGEARIGGLVGRTAVGVLTMTDCVNNAPLTVQNAACKLSVGGLVGSTTRSLTLEYCTNNANVTLTNISGTAQCGGLAATAGVLSGHKAILNSCVNNGVVDVQVASGATATTSAAGLIGEFSGAECTAKYCSSTELSQATNTTNKNTLINSTKSVSATVVERVVVDKDGDGYNLIKTAEDFKNIIAIGYDAKFRLANDIDFNNEVFDTYIVGDVFKGIIDGANHSITNFSFLAEDGKVAVFNQLQDATISDLTVGTQAAPISYELTAYDCGDGNYRKGLFAQETAETGTVTLDNVTVYGEMDITMTTNKTPNGPIGGFIGLAQGELSFTDCVFNGSITVKDAAELVTDQRSKHIGAFFGQVYAREGRSTNLTLTNCINNADITVQNSCKEAYVGSLAGHFENAKATVNGFTNTGDINLTVTAGTSCLGAYIGHVSGTANRLSELITLTGCSSSGTLTGPEAQPEIGKVELTAPALPPVDDSNDDQTPGTQPDTTPNPPAINKPSDGAQSGADTEAPADQTEAAETEAPAADTEEADEGGCKSSFAGSAALILTTIVLACALTQKKKETN